MTFRGTLAMSPTTDQGVREFKRAEVRQDAKDRAAVTTVETLRRFC